MCAVCGTAPAAVVDHCHEHGYVRAPVCHSCNTHERPDHLYSNDIRVASRYIRLFDNHSVDWLRHWHRCPGCRTRTTLPLPHLAAWTAHTACRPLRPTHHDPRSSRGRKPCGAVTMPSSSTVAMSPRTARVLDRQPQHTPFLPDHYRRRLLPLR
ncbi:endonuclease domain-containing protein [Streptomyces chryseus]